MHNLSKYRGYRLPAKPSVAPMPTVQQPKPKTEPSPKSNPENEK